MRTSQINMELGASTASPHYSRFNIEVPKENREGQQREIYRVKLEKGQDGWIIAKCQDIKGAISQGKNKDEALRNILEAIETILEDIFHDQAPEFSIILEET